MIYQKWPFIWWAFEDAVAKAQLLPHGLMKLNQTNYRALLMAYLRPQRGKVLLLLLLLLLSSGLQLVNPQIVRQFIDARGPGAEITTLTKVALLFLAVALLGQAIYAAVSYLTVDVGWTAANALHEDLVAHCLQLDLTFHAAHLPGAIMSS